MKKINMLFLIVMASMFFAALAFAADMDQSSTSDAGMNNMQSQEHMGSSNITADELKGMAVIDQNGKDIGEIKDVKADQDTGRVDFVILAKGGMMGIGETKCAVPIRALNINLDKKQATLNVDQSLLASAPKQAPDVSNKDFELQLEQHYGIAPAWKSDQNTSEPQMQQSQPDQSAPQQQDQETPTDESNNGGY